MSRAKFHPLRREPTRFVIDGRNKFLVRYSDGTYLAPPSIPDGSYTRTPLPQRAAVMAKTTGDACVELAIAPHFPDAWPIEAVTYSCAMGTDEPYDRVVVWQDLRGFATGGTCKRCGQAEWRVGFARSADASEWNECGAMGNGSCRYQYGHDPASVEMIDYLNANEERSFPDALAFIANAISRELTTHEIEYLARMYREETGDAPMSERDRLYLVGAAVLGYIEASEEPALDGALEHAASEMGRKLTASELEYAERTFVESVEAE